MPPFSSISQACCPAFQPEESERTALQRFPGPFQEAQAQSLGLVRRASYQRRGQRRQVPAAHEQGPPRAALLRGHRSVLRRTGALQRVEAPRALSSELHFTCRAPHWDILFLPMTRIRNRGDFEQFTPDLSRNFLTGELLGSHFIQMMLGVMRGLACVRLQGIAPQTSPQGSRASECRSRLLS